MKFTIDIESKELAEFLAEFANSMHKSYRNAEQEIGEILLGSMVSLDKKENKKTEEVPAGGYFH